MDVVEVEVLKCAGCEHHNETQCGFTDGARLVPFVTCMPTLRVRIAFSWQSHSNGKMTASEGCVHFPRPSFSRHTDNRPRVRFSIDAVDLLIMRYLAEVFA